MSVVSKQRLLLENPRSKRETQQDFTVFMLVKDGWIRQGEALGLNGGFAVVSILKILYT